MRPVLAGRSTWCVSSLRRHWATDWRGTGRCVRCRGCVLSKFFTSHLAGERAASPKTVSSYRDAMKLLLTWFRDTEHIPPEKLRLADIDRPRILRFLDWLEAERGCSPATRNQRLAVIKSFCRYTAVEQPDQLGRVTQVLAIRQKKTPAPQLDHLAGDEVKTLLAEPGTASARAVRDTVLLALAYDTAARVQELCDLDVADIRRGSPMTVVIHGKGSKIRYVPVMDPTARLVGDYLDHRDRHPGAGAGADPLFAGPNHSRLTRSGVAKLLARHVKTVRARDPGWAPGLPVTPHTLRRSRAMHLVQARRQPDLHPRPPRPRRCLHHRDLRQSRRRGQAQSDRERLRTTHPGRPAGLDLGLVSGRLARLAQALTPSPEGLCGPQYGLHHFYQRKLHSRAHNPGVRIMSLMRNSALETFLRGRHAPGLVPRRRRHRIPDAASVGLPRPRRPLVHAALPGPAGPPALTSRPHAPPARPACGRSSSAATASGAAPSPAPRWTAASRNSAATGPDAPPAQRSAPAPAPPAPPQAPGATTPPVPRAPHPAGLDQQAHQDTTTPASPDAGKR